MKALARIITLFLFSFIFSKSIAQGYLEFVENKGQWDKEIKYKGSLVDGAFALKANGGYKMLVLNQTDLANLSPHHKIDSSNSSSKGLIAKKVFSKNPTNSIPNKSLRGHVYEVNFLNSNPNPIIITDKPINSYNNYFIGNDPQKWAGHCGMFGAITFKDIYPNIDVRYYSESGNLKYDFIIHPGGDANLITLYFKGADDLKLSEGNLIINTSIREVKELRPYTYQFNDLGKNEVSSSFIVKGNIVKFKLNEQINLNKTLVIDPLIFSTFSGSKADN